MANNHEHSFSKGLTLGMIIGGAVGALVALLFAPKSGRELRRDIAERSGELYDKASVFAQEQSEKIGEYINEGRVRAEELVRNARQQAGTLLSEAETLISDARSRMSSAQYGIKDNISRIQDAARAGAEAFQSEMAKTRDT
ncbi:MAG: YtxH domain-containing protein [Bacteroidota bacterium]|nr:YtxH domain-containing protein [Candidatus Kapabacteria bacterium]MDW8219809.1 YtxH domain-containing protein [Bacteroidota bacterium]